MPILERLAICDLPPEAAILDLCSGTGRVAAALTERGFRVVGVEGSAEMVRYARENAPEAEFLVDDARTFALDGPFALAISVFESLNHVMSVEELGAVFSNVHRSLSPGARFIFDLNREPVFEKFWNLHYIIAEDDHVCASRANYRAPEKIADCEITMFRLNGEWRRSDTLISQKCHDVEAVRRSLEKAGFADIELLDAAEDLGMTGDIAFARTFFRARRF